MKRISYIILLFAFSVAGTLSAQFEAQPDSTRSIFDELSKPGKGKGTVVVKQSPAIKAMVGRKLNRENIKKDEDQAFIKTEGYRTQVFSGNNQRKSKDEAIRKEEMIKELFPDIPTYLKYDAPFWKLRVGDFRSREEAYQMQRQLMDAFPTFAKEMYIVKDEIKIPL